MMSLSREILYNRTIQHPERPLMPIYMGGIQNHLISKKQAQKQYFNKSHNTKPLPQLNPGQELLFLSPADQSSHTPNIIVDKALTLQSYTIEAQGKKYHRTREHICPIQQDIISKKTIHHLEPQENPKLSCIPKPSPYTRAQLQSKIRSPKAGTTQPSTSHVPWSSPLHTSQLKHTPLPSIPTRTVDLLSHLTVLNDYMPSRHTGDNEAYPTYQYISDTDNIAPCARLIGTSEDHITNYSASSTNMMHDNSSHHSQCVTLSQPGTASDPLKTEASHPDQGYPYITRAYHWLPITAAQPQNIQHPEPLKPQHLEPFQIKLQLLWPRLPKQQSRDQPQQWLNLAHWAVVPKADYNIQWGGPDEAPQQATDPEP